jgi:pimeloyl-ACP methyl ester carboxylesterase
MVGFIEPVGTVIQSAQAERKQHVRMTNAIGPRYSRQRFFENFMQTPVELADWTGLKGARSAAPLPARDAVPTIGTPPARHNVPMLARALTFLLLLCTVEAHAVCSDGPTTLAGVPAIVSVPTQVTKPPILLWHGFGAPASEAALQEALPLADVPAIKVYLGLPLFGERAPAPGEPSVSQRQQEDYGARIFEPVVMGAANELPAVVKALRERKCLRANEPIGLFGFSAGGAAVLFALAEHRVPVRVAVTVNAPVGLEAAIDAMERVTKRPYAWTPATRKLAQRSDAVRRASDVATGRPALLLFHGADDTVVRPDGAASLRVALQPFYRSDADRLQLVVAPGVAHDWTEPRTLDVLRASVSDWFARNL